MVSVHGVIQITSITGALWLSGKISSQGLVTIPALLCAASDDGVSSAALIQIWRRIYEAGHAHSPQIAALTSTGFTYLAWSSYIQDTAMTPALLYGSAASLVMTIIPYTLVFMGPVNQELMARAAEEDKPACRLSSPVNDPEPLSKKTATIEILRVWGLFAGLRGLLPLTGGILGLVATTQF